MARRKFLGYLVGGSGLVAAANVGLLGSPPEAAAAVPTAPVPAELADLNDVLSAAALPTSQLITVEVHEDGTASFELPRAEVGQGITTSIAMIVAEELELPLDKVDVSLAPARPELLFNQLTGGSNTIFAMYTPVRVAAAIAKGALLEAASNLLGDTVDALQAKAGEIIGVGGKSVTYGELVSKAAVPRTTPREVVLKPVAEYNVVGTPQPRKDARAAITGQKQFAMDLAVDGALPAMICRAPTVHGTPKAVRNAAEVKAMNGVTHVEQVPTGVAVRAQTFGQCIDAIRALQVDWNPGTAEGESDESILAEVHGAELPMVVPQVPVLTETLDYGFEFYTRSGSPLEPNCAVADIRADGGTVWASAKSPIAAREEIAAAVGLPVDKLVFNVVEGGGSFGRKLFFDGALEAAHVSKACQAPVRLMWHRADEPRQGRSHPITTSRIRVTRLADQVLTYEHRHTGVAVDLTHGLGEAITAGAAKLPVAGNLTFAETIFTTTQYLPYDFGVVDQLLLETGAHDRFPTSAVRNVYSPDVRAANELVVDRLAERMGKDPYEFRMGFLREERVRRVLEKVAEEGEWGKRMPEHCAQGIAIHEEYKGATACLVEIDCRPETVNRRIRDARTGPLVTKVTFAVDPGLAINPTGVEAQMQGGISDGIALALTNSSHLADGHFLEASWDNSAYTRQWNTPRDIQVFVMPSEHPPGGAGEAGVAATFAATACAYGRAVGEMPTYFPINHKEPLHFEPKSFVPPVPESPTDGLTHTF
ncbi:molybdopterin-dependent oxidoreductase [Saccharopolyspora gloriosae]|uniref:Isoquinoline 1-oxidoreductase beta subunit n=1 Tax=Saccharopolyspora gloriosae TaxID=455344 RepID=A0A840NGN8_9PSEU|nr:molybdopterin cofactor-binding domain-containing protein [Saccharopolyspora gloriosae]MBB5068362.1 isoquinoline 1-oxidoreductase beta subunit [Saccharopolyspora gloriosae]